MNVNFPTVDHESLALDGRMPSANSEFCSKVDLTTAAGAQTYLSVAIPRTDIIGVLDDYTALRPFSTSLAGKLTLWAGTGTNGTALTADNTCSTSTGSNITLSGTASESVILGTYARIASPSNGGTASSPTFNITGTAEASNTVSVVVKEGVTTKCTLNTTANVSEAWTVNTSTCALAYGGSYSIEVSSSDGTNTATDSAAVTFTKGRDPELRTETVASHLMIYPWISSD